jgi:hypothetical protein
LAAALATTLSVASTPEKATRKALRMTLSFPNGQRVAVSRIQLRRLQDAMLLKLLPRTSSVNHPGVSLRHVLKYGRVLCPRMAHFNLLMHEDCDVRLACAISLTS